MEPKIVADIDLSRLPEGSRAQSHSGHTWKIVRSREPNKNQERLAKRVLAWGSPRAKHSTFVTNEKGQNIAFRGGQWIITTSPSRTIDTSTIKLPKMRVADVDLRCLPVGTRIARCNGPTINTDWVEIVCENGGKVVYQPFNHKGELWVTGDGEPRTLLKHRSGSLGERRSPGDLYYETAILPKFDPSGATTETVEAPTKPEPKRAEEMSLSEWLECEAWESA